LSWLEPRGMGWTKGQTNYWTKSHLFSLLMLRFAYLLVKEICSSFSNLVKEICSSFSNFNFINSLYKITQKSIEMSLKLISPIITETVLIFSKTSLKIFCSFYSFCFCQQWFQRSLAREHLKSTKFFQMCLRVISYRPYACVLRAVRMN